MDSPLGYLVVPIWIVREATDFLRRCSVGMSGEFRPRVLGQIGGQRRPRRAGAAVPFQGESRRPSGGTKNAPVCRHRFAIHSPAVIRCHELFTPFIPRRLP